VTTEEGRRRPDVTVNLPGGGLFPIDAKVSLNAFLESQRATNEAERSDALLRHAQSLRTHAQSLANKAYWQQFESSPDFVAMFVPGDGFLAAAIECMPDLMSDAMDRRVLIVTPTTLFALCKAVAYGWRVEEQAENAREIADLGQELYRRLSVMGGHVAGLGAALSGAVTKYNAFVGSLESQVLTQARRFEDLQVESSKPLEELESVEADCRPLAKLAGSAEDPEPELVEMEP
jgi:DNA recombination protein RmuC